jgi:WD40 repeat protein
VAFAPDGKSVYTNDGALQRWELATGRPMLPDTYAAGHRAEISRVVYSRDGRLLATSAQDGTIRIWDVATAKILHIMHTTREGDRMDLAFTSDAARLLSTGNDGDLHVWDATTGQKLRRITLHDVELGEGIQYDQRLHLTQDDKTVIVLGHAPDGLGGTVSNWDLATGRRSTVATINEPGSWYTAFSPDGLTLISQGQLYDTSSGKPRFSLDGSGIYLPYAYSPDGRLVAGMSTRDVPEGRWAPDGSRVWNAASGQTVMRLDTAYVGNYA